MGKNQCGLWEIYIWGVVLSPKRNSTKKRPIKKHVGGFQTGPEISASTLGFSKEFASWLFWAPRGVLAALGPPGALQGAFGGPFGRFSQGSWRLLGRSWRLLGRSWRLPEGSNLVLGRTKNIPGAPTSDKKLDQPGFEPETFGSTLLLRRCLSH